MIDVGFLLDSMHKWQSKTWCYESPPTMQIRIALDHLAGVIESRKGVIDANGFRERANRLMEIVDRYDRDHPVHWEYNVPDDAPIDVEDEWRQTKSRGPLVTEIFATDEIVVKTSPGEPCYEPPEVSDAMLELSRLIFIFTNEYGLDEIPISGYDAMIDRRETEKDRWARLYHQKRQTETPDEAVTRGESKSPDSEKTSGERGDVDSDRRGQIEWSKLTSKKSLDTALRVSRNTLNRMLVEGIQPVLGKIRYIRASGRARLIQVAIEDLPADLQPRFRPSAQ